MATSGTSANDLSAPLCRQKAKQLGWTSAFSLKNSDACDGNELLIWWIPSTMRKSCGHQFASLSMCRDLRLSARVVLPVSLAQPARRPPAGRSSVAMDCPLDMDGEGVSRLPQPLSLAPCSHEAARRGLVSPSSPGSAPPVVPLQFLREIVHEQDRALIATLVERRPALGLRANLAHFPLLR